MLNIGIYILLFFAVIFLPVMLSISIKEEKEEEQQ
jgi:hypothetical protein